MIDLEKEVLGQGFDFVIGVDEAGRGPLAGPVTAAAVLLKDYTFQNKIDDSKKLSSLQRLKAFEEIYNKAIVGVGIMSEEIIDRNNILEATYLAMNNAINDLISRLPGGEEENLFKRICVLVDGNRIKSDLPYTFKTVVAGDSKVLSIACASIIAKVTRDRILDAYDQVYPEYGFKRHKGYPTLLHRQAIRRYGLSSIHRKSFHHA